MARLTKLSIKYWKETMILEIMLEVGKPLDIDDFTSQLQKSSYTCMRIALDAIMPLKLGVFIRGQKGVF